MNDKFQNTILAMLFFVTLIIVAFLFYYIPIIFLSLFFAILIIFTVNPIIEFLTKLKIPRSISAIFILFLITGFLIILGFITYNSIVSIIAEFPRYSDRFKRVFYAILNQLEALDLDRYGIEFDKNDINLTTILTKLFFQLQNQLQSIVNGSLNLLKYTFTTMLFTFFMIIELSHITDKIESIFTDKIKFINMGRDIAKQISKYLIVKFFTSSLTAVVIYIEFTIIGLDFAFIWAILIFLFNWIPSIGSIMITLIIFIFSLVQFFPANQIIILVFFCATIPQILIGNILDPKLIGDNLNISPLVILVSLFLWGHIWGVAGMFLAIPLMVIFKIICDNVPSLNNISIVLNAKVKNN